MPSLTNGNAWRSAGVCCRGVGLMSRNSSALCVLVLMLSSGVVCADIDLKDFDDDLMRDMDYAIKDLEPVVGARNAAAAKGDAEFLLEGFKQTEGYFAKKGTADDAVRFARKSEELAVTVLQNIQANDFDAAANSARELSKSCRNCHDVYKPLTK
jgi:cytochrome c556